MKGGRASVQGGQDECARVEERVRMVRVQWACKGFRRSVQGGHDECGRAEGSVQG